MAESIADRYRSRYPPKEHEEAVRMLLDGVDKEQIEATINNRRATKAPKMTTTTTATTKTKTKTNNYHRQRMRPPRDSSSLEDRKSVNSCSTATNETNSSGVDTTHDQSQTDSHGNGMASKSTSTCESVSVAESAGVISEKSTISDEAIQTGHDLIPSRTIAVQCDLKWSSVRNRDALFDTSMQASSISSTRYGFYSYNHDTLAKRHRMQRSTSYRNLDRADVYDEDTTTTRGYRDRLQPISTEAPTSMSELSSAELSPTSDSENNLPPDERQNSRRERAGGELFSSPNQRWNGQPAAPSGERLEPKGPGLQQVSRLSPRGRQMYGSVLDNSMSTARARIDSLPRRPMTAMSYVSPNKLRHKAKQQQPQSDSNSDSDADVDEMKAPPRRVSSSVSHQNLVRPKTPAPSGNLSSSNASSDSELARSKPRDAHLASGRRRPHKNASDEEEENARSEEMILTAGSGRQRPQLVEARHQEEVQDLNGMLEQFRRAELELRNNTPGQKSRFSTLRPAAKSSGVDARGPSKDSAGERSRFAASTMSLPRKTTKRSQMVALDDDDDADARRRPQNDGAQLVSSRGAHEAQRIGQVGRSTSMRQTSGRPSIARRYERPDRSFGGQHEPYAGDRYEPAAGMRLQTDNPPARNRSLTLGPALGGGGASGRGATRATNEHDSDALESKTWSNPAGVSFRSRGRRPPGSDSPPEQLEVSQRGAVASARRGAARSMSMRDVNETSRYGAGMSGTASGYTPSSYRSNASFTARYNDDYSSSESSDLVANENVVRNLAARLSPLDYDSSQRLNESGLPEVNTARAAASYLSSPKSHLHASQDGLQQRYLSSTLNGRTGGQIKGRAMSQQSLTRPTMPLTASGRRWQMAGSASSDVGGSSMSLATRLHGRYESAHTRSPIVMYIPPASNSRAGSLRGDDSLLGASRAQRSTLKRGSRSPRNRSRPGSQDRSTIGLRRQKSVSRNGSDSESSSILRTLVRARASRGAAESAYSSKRIARMQNIPVNNMIDTDEEDMDGVGRLATELDSYKFTRRYSVPKDAKINWFSRLRQRVASGNR